ncbi:Ig-like domain-containing protein [Thermobrachium celere]|uniref:Uncharacterized protein n=2 Tax=Thermobrachium TaxID=150333 RepID=R7RNN6_9CLOT|nr:Ig-like domain-containing protein [Thermobrachium celere]CDF57649.1 hypothetical protein TCEL_01563 [Thermobrachium celere DSM 8682]
MNKKYKFLSSLLLSLTLLSNTAFAGTYTITTKDDLYNALKTDALNLDTTGTYTFKGLSSSTVNSWLKDAAYIIPEYGNSTKGWEGSYTINGSDVVYNLQFNRHLTKEQYNQVVTKVREVLPNIINENMNTLEKEKAIHDWIIQNVDYDYTYNSYDAYKALFSQEHKTVCNGYAMLADIMFREAGIDSKIVLGYAYQNGKKVGHAWNMVNLDGNWYHVDLTWDDLQNGNVRYDYFNLRTEEIKKDHIQTSISPATSTIPFDQYIVNVYGSDTSKYLGLYGDQILDKVDTIDDLATYLKKALDENKTSVKFAYKGTFSSAINTLKIYLPQLTSYRYAQTTIPRLNGTGYNVVIVQDIVKSQTTPKSLTAMKFTKTTIDVRSGQTYDLKQILNIYPLGIDTPELNWESSNTKILTVTNEGIVIPVTTGVAYVKVSSKANPKIAAYIKVQVPVEVQSVSLKQDNIYMNVGSSTIPYVIFNPTNATYRTFTMSSNYSSIVDVYNGKLVAKSVGQATITITSTDNPSETATLTVYVVKPVTSLTVNKTSTMIKAGKTEAIETTVLPADATDKTLIWESSNPTVAEVSQDGIITAKAPGTVRIKVSSKTNPNVYKVINVTVPVDLQGISTPYSNFYVKLGSTYTPSITYNPTNATIKTVTYESDNPSVLSIVNGKPLAKALGTANLTVKAVDGDYKVTIKVTVIQTPVTSIGLNKTTMNLAVGGSDTLTVTVYPTNASIKDYYFISSNESVAKVDETGKVTAVSKGTAVIKVVSVQNPSITKTCYVYVK